MANKSHGLIEHPVNNNNNFIILEKKITIKIKTMKYFQSLLIYTSFHQELPFPHTIIKCHLLVLMTLFDGFVLALEEQDVCVCVHVCGGGDN